MDEEELQELQKLIDEVAHVSHDILSSFASKNTETKINDDNGLDLLTLKNISMLDYIQSLTSIADFRCKAISLGSNEAIKEVERAATSRLVLDRIRPIEKKLKHSIDKSLRAFNNADNKDNEDENDPEMTRPNPEALVAKLDEESDENEEDDEELKTSINVNSTKKYVAPRNLPMPFPGDEEDNNNAANSSSSKRRVSKALLDELRSQHLDAPEEVHEKETTSKRRHVQAMRERERYEEENFVRLPVSKKQKHSREQVSTVASLADEIAGFNRRDYDSVAKKKGGKKKIKKKRLSFKKKK